MRNKCIFCKGDTDDAAWVTLNIEDEVVEADWACRACSEKLRLNGADVLRSIWEEQR